MQLCAPFALFFLNSSDKLLPVAIQLYQDKHNPVSVFSVGNITTKHTILEKVLDIYLKYHYPCLKYHYPCKVFTPGIDEHKWTLAKMWFNVVDSCHHQLCYHLGKFTLVSVSFCYLKCRCLNFRKVKKGNGFCFLICTTGLTHLAMDGVAVTVNRCLAKNHPIFRLLAPHFLYLFAINK